jgi:hypothetical protein
MGEEQTVCKIQDSNIFALFSKRLFDTPHIVKTGLRDWQTITTTMELEDNILRVFISYPEGRCAVRQDLAIDLDSMFLRKLLEHVVIRYVDKSIGILY